MAHVCLNGGSRNEAGMPELESIRDLREELSAQRTENLKLCQHISQLEDEKVRNKSEK